MVPPAAVLTNKNCGGKLLFHVLTVAACLWIFGCSPPGPRALLEGKRLLEEGNYPEAVASLEKASSLLPKNALAWNYLGLAYHAARQHEQAVKAYRVALSLDHKLAAVRYNLGCLYLEQDNVTNALEELRSFTLLQPGAPDGWLKLGAAQNRARRLDEAERSFRTALDLQARHPEALNGLGLVQMQRRRYLEALNHFNAAATQEPPYPPAVLNAAIVQQQLNNRTAALNRYRQYLGFKTADAAAVEMMVRQLEGELNPPSLSARATAVPPPPAGKGTNAGLTSVNPNWKAPVNIPPSLTPVPARSNLISGVNTSATTASSSSAGGASNAAIKTPAEPPRTLVRPAPPKGAEALTIKPAEVEVTQLQADPVVRQAQEISRVTAPPAEIIEAPPSGKTATNAARRGFFSRLNPFGGRNRTNVATGESRTTVIRTPPAPSAVRYSYLAPAVPTPGNAGESKKAFERGVKAQRAGSLPLAITEYQAAVKADPANFDAYYNLGLASLERGDARLSLWAYEIALALQPENGDARYNFALALKAGGHWLDAGEQFEKLLSENPSDARAHLSLANLLAQQLQQPSLAREHYQRVLELNPKHPEAAKIRFWLAANP